MMEINKNRMLSIFFGCLILEPINYVYAGVEPSKSNSENQEVVLLNSQTAHIRVPIHWFQPRLVVTDP